MPLLDREPGRGIELITAAALQYDGVIYTLPQPARHYHVMKEMVANGLPEEALNLRYQGFVTNTGRFVDRYAAAKIARAAGQLVRAPTPPDMLTSEDVW